MWFFTYTHTHTVLDPQFKHVTAKIVSFPDRYGGPSLLPRKLVSHWQKLRFEADLL